MGFSIKNFFSKCDQISSFLQRKSYWRNPFWKTSVFVQCLLCNTSNLNPVHFDTKRRPLDFERMNKLNWKNLLPASKNEWKWLKNCYDYQLLEKVCRTSFSDNKILEVGNNCECCISKKIQENQYCVFKLQVLSLFFVCVSNCRFYPCFFVCVSPVFISFHSYFWLSLEQQSDKGHVSIRCQMSIKLFVIAMILLPKQDMMPYWIYRKNI